MRRCRKMISVIMLMVMLVSLLPTGAMAAEAPTGATNEVADVEEPKDAGGETVSSEGAVIETSGTGTDEAAVTDEIPGETSVSDGTEESGVENAADVATVGEIAPEEEPVENTAEATTTGETSVEIAPEVEPVEKEAKAAGSPINLKDNGRVNEVTMNHRQPGGSWTPVTESSPVQENDELQIGIKFKVEAGALTSESNTAIYKFPKGIQVKNNQYGINVSLPNDDNTIVGSLNLENQSDNSVLATLTFKDEYLNAGEAVEGYFQYEYLVTLKEPKDPTFYHFDGTNTDFEVDVKSFYHYDVGVEKSNSELKLENGVYKTTYTLKVSSKKGEGYLGTRGTVTVTDTVTYSNESFYSYKNVPNSIVVKDMAGKTVTGYKVDEFTDKSIKITGLPKLEAGQYYTVSYDAEIEQLKKEFTEGETTKENVGTTVENTVKATSGPEESTVTHTLSVKPELSKLFDNGSISGTRVWTIYLNRNNATDIAGYTVTDTMLNGMKAISDITIKGKNHTVVIENKDQDMTTFSYTFDKSVWGDDTKSEIKITFTADLKGATAETTSNNATIIYGPDTYSVTRTIPGLVPSKTAKARVGVCWELGNEYTMAMDWKLSYMELPTNLSAGNSYTYEDYLHQHMYYYRNKKWVKIDGDCLHYTYSSEVFKALNKNIKLTTSDGYYKFDADSATTCLFSANDKTYTESNAITFTLTGLDASGKTYDIVANRNNSTIKLTRFRITVKANKDLAFGTAALGGKAYTSYFYYGKDLDLVANGNESVYFFNDLTSLSDSSKSSQDYHGWILGSHFSKKSNISQEDGKIYIDYTVIAHYDLINLGGEVVLTDQRSFGEEYSGGLGTYVDGSAKAEIYSDEACETMLKGGDADTLASKGYFSVDSSNDKEGKLLFKFDVSSTEAYNATGRRVKITYRVRVDDDEWWSDPNHKIKVYKNEIDDPHGHHAESSTSLEKTNEVINKSGYQEYLPREGNPEISDPLPKVNYTIEINPSASDLDPEKETVALVDTLEDSTADKIWDFDYNCKLYYYDKNEEDHIKKNEQGQPDEVAEGEWTSDYSDKDNKLTVTVKDKTAYVLKYSYSCNAERLKQEEEVILKNEAQLGGFRVENVEPVDEEVVIAHVVKRTIDFTKAGESSNVHLAGAEFDLQEYADGDWKSVTNYTSANDGQIVIDIVDLGLKTDVAYRLLETKAAKGYTNKTKEGEQVAFYFVIKADGESEEDARSKVEEAIPQTIPESNKKFFDYYGGKASITNRAVGELSVKKIVKNGNTADNSKEFSFIVTLSDTSINGVFGEMTFKNGKAEFTLKHNQTKTATDLPTNVKYTVVEKTAEGYSVTKKGDTGTISKKKSSAEFTNTPDSMKIDVTKVWVDGENAKNTRPAAVTIKLLANGKDTGKTLELNAKNEWKGSFDGLDKNDANGEITYTIEEDSVGNYMVAITGNAANGFAVTNTLKTNIAVEKVWNDANNQDGKRPASITVHLKKNGVNLYSATLNESNGWKRTWPNLPAYDEDGKEITYSVTEDTVTGYTAGKPVKSETTDKNGVTTVTYTITNSYSPDTVNAKVRKIWVDDNNADNLRTSIEVQLTKNGTPMTGDAYKQTLNKANNWEYEWTGLPANDAGVPITYSIAEITVIKGYNDNKKPEIKTSYDEASKTWNISVTNKHDRSLIEIPVEKVWRDDKTQHGSITVKLLKGGKDTGKTLELNEANGFKGEFTGLPKFENEGKEIEYTIEEVEVTGYTTAITGSAAEGFKITNTILTNIAVEKVWDDANDQDRKRPTSITVHLTKNNTPMEGEAYTATLKAEENWKGYTWSDLPAYDEDGKKITYSVKEDPVAEYTAGDPVKKSEATDEETGVKTVTYSIKNSYSPDTVHAKVVKKWEDNNDQDGLRTSIEVELTKNGTGMGDAYKQTLNEANNWTYQWDGLPANDAGVPITYSIAEITVIKGYNDNKKPEIKTSYDEASKTWNISVTNTHTPIKTVASVTKVWDDGNDIEGLQPKEIKVQLLDATGDKEIPVRDEVTLNAENEWTYTWTELDKFKEKGTEIKYTVREVSVPEGYTDEVKVAKDLEGKFKITVTNRHGGRPVSISKTDITNSKEVEGATLQILLNNEVVTAKDAEGKDARAEWTSTKEPHKVYGLTPGVTYTLRETIQPEGFTIIEADTTFSVDENGKVTATGSKVKDNIILVEDAPTFVKVKKVDATSQEEVEGAHIQILDGDKVFDEWDSKKGVVHEVKYLVADRKYTLRETVAPLGYTVISDTEFTVNNKNEVTYKGETVSETIDGVPVILVEDTMTIVKISKTDITGDKELKGATLQILDEKGEVVTVKDRKGKDVKCEWESTDEPHVVEGLEINKTYTLREKVGPEGFKIVTDATFSIDEKNRVTYSGKKNASGVLLVQDEPIRLYVSKQAITGDEELPGATLQILDEKENVVVIKDNDGNPVETLEWVSGEEPKYIECLPVGVNYILRETISPDGYAIASDTKFSVDENGVVTSDGTTSTAEDGTTVLVVKDDFTTVQISKVDTESGAELEGAKLQIIDEENNIVEEWTSTKEVHVVRGLIANKKYILREQVAPLGYTLTSDTTFSIDMNNVVTSTGPVNKDGVILVNDTMTEVEILKVDSKTGKGLAGAKLQVLDDNGAVCDEWKSTKDAHKIKGLYTGVKYTLHEVEAPKGYDKAKDITFTIDTAGKVSSDALDNGKIVMKDTPTPKKNKTGDEANGSLWALLLMMASGALGGTVWFKRKRRA